MTSAKLDISRGAEGLVDYAKSLDCIHCGLCLRTCPTYTLTGVESSSPRGRIHLMRSVAEGRLDADEAFADEMDHCLVCRHCESVCPAGVEFGSMMEFTRDGLLQSNTGNWLGRVMRWTGFRVVLRRRWALNLVGIGLRAAQITGLLGLVGRGLGDRGKAMMALPTMPPWRKRRRLPAMSSAQGPRVAQVSMLTGCVMPTWLGRVNRSTAHALTCAGCDVATAPDHVCCGALHAHNGELDSARELARGTIAAFDGLRNDAGAPLPVIVNSAGCGAHMREYGALLASDPKWKSRAEAFADRVRDFSEFLARGEAGERLKNRLNNQPAFIALGKVAFDDPCHLCHGQQIREQPRELLSAIPGLQQVELEESESCCGSAGIYSVLRPKESMSILATKLEQLERSGADTLVTANPGCQLQWEGGLRMAQSKTRVLHVAEVVSRALSQQGQEEEG